MDIRKTTSLVKDDTGKAELEYFNSLKSNAKIIINCTESLPCRRALLIIKTNGDTYTYTWNSCKHLFDCIYQHKNRESFGNFTKAKTIENIAIDLYQNADYKFI